MRQFSYRSARSGSFVAGITVAILVETAAVHLLLYTRSRLAAWSLTALSVWAIIWLVRDYRALGNGSITLDNEKVDLTVGRRYWVRLLRTNISSVSRPSFRDLPTPGTDEARDFLNLFKSATPNVLIVVREPVSVRLPAGLHRSVSRFALHLDDPGEFIDSIRHQE